MCVLDLVKLAEIHCQSAKESGWEQREDGRGRESAREEEEEVRKGERRARECERGRQLCDVRWLVPTCLLNKRCQEGRDNVMETLTVVVNGVSGAGVSPPVGQVMQDGRFR